MGKKQKLKGNAAILNSLSIIFSISTIVIVLLANFEMFAFSSSYYQKQFASLGVYSDFEMRGISRQQVNLYSEKIILFLTDKGELPAGFFNSDEESHMMDVRHLFLAVNYAFIAAIALSAASIALLLGLFKRRGAIKTALCFSRMAICVIIFIGIVGVLMIFQTNFERIFIGFHEIFFPEGNWAFPEGSTIITLFPEAFFRQMAVSIFLLSAAELAALAVLSFLYIKSPNFRKL